jgi:hypothetical protein
MLSDLVDLCRKAVASIQSALTTEVSAAARQGTHSGRQAKIHGAERERKGARRWASGPSEYRSDFGGEAPGALVNAYREAAEGDDSDHLHRRSFVI